MMTEIRPHLAQTPTSACRCAWQAPKTTIAVKRLIVSHAATARTPLVASSLSLAANHVTLGRQTTIQIPRRHVFSACPASTQRSGTTVTALAVRVVASLLQLVAQRCLRVSNVSRVSTARRGHRRVRSARLAELMRTWMLRLSALSAASGRMLGVARHHVMSVLLARSTVTRMQPHRVRRAMQASTGR